MSKFKKGGYKVLITLLALMLFVSMSGSAQAAMTYGATTATSDGAYTLDGIATSTYLFGPSTTTGTITIGGTAQTGSTTIRSSNATGATTLSAFVLNAGAVTSGTALYLTTTADSGNAVVISDNALTTGVGLSVPHTTSIIANGGSLARLSSTSIDTSTTTGVLLDLSSTASTAGTQVLKTFSGLTTGIGESMVVNALLGGTGSSIASSSVGMTGNLASLTLSGNNVANTGALLNLSSSGVSSISPALVATVASTGAFANGGVRFNFSGAHTGNGFQIDDVTTAGKVAQINANSVVGGTGVEINTNGLTTGLGLGVLHTTAIIANGGSLARLSSTSIDTGTTTGNLLDLSSTASTAGTQVLKTFSGLTTGIGESMVVNALLGGTGSSIASSSVGMTGNLASLTLSGNNVANTGALLNLSSSGVSSISPALVATVASTGAFANGGVRFNFSGAHTGNGFQIDDVTTAGKVAQINANSVVGGTILELNGNALTTGVGLNVVHTSSIIAAGGSLARISSTSVDTSTTTGTLLDLSATATTVGKLVNIASSAAGQTTSNLLNVVASGYTTGYTGDVVKFTGVSTDGASNVLNIVSANTSSGNALSVTAAAATTGAGIVVTAPSSSALAVGLTGKTNPAFVVDASTGSQVAGLKIKGAVTGGTVAVSAIDSGADASVTIDGKGAGTVGIGTVSTGRVTTGSANAVNVRPGNAVRATADLTATTNVTLANITGLSMNLEAGRKYVIRAKLFTTSTANGGLKVGFGGTATATSMIAEAKSYTTTTLNGSAQVTALGAILGATVATDSAEIWAEIIVNAAGTLTIQAAQNASHADTTTVKIGSFMIIEDVI